MDDLDAPILANNLYDWETDERLYDAYRILDIGGLSVGSSDDERLRRSDGTRVLRGEVPLR